MHFLIFSSSFIFSFPIFATIAMHAISNRYYLIGNIVDSWEPLVIKNDTHQAMLIRMP